MTTTSDAHGPIDFVLLEFPNDRTDGSAAEALLEQFAGELGMDVSKFRSALDSGKFKGAVAADQKAAQSAGIGGTPTVLVNGRKIAGAVPFPSFKALIDAELHKGKGGALVPVAPGRAMPPVRLPMGGLKMLPKAPAPPVPAKPAPPAPQ